MFNVNIPHLQHLKLDVWDRQYGWRQSQTIEGILQKNPQVQSAAFLGFPGDWIRTVEQLMPNCIDLLVDEFDSFDEPIHVNNIKHFTCNDMEPLTIHELTFSQLESLEMKYDSDYFENWMEFFSNHKSLPKLSLKMHYRSEVGQELVEITNELPELVDLSVEYLDDTYIDVITRIIQTHNKLRRFEFRTHSELDMTQLHQLFDDKWHLSCGDAIDLYTVLLKMRV